MYEFNLILLYFHHDVCVFDNRITQKKQILRRQQ